MLRRVFISAVLFVPTNSSSAVSNGGVTFVSMVRRVLVVCCSLYPLILLLHGFQGGDDLRLRRASIFAKQALLTSTPDGGIAFRHGNSDGVGVYSVWNHFRVTHHGQDRVARGVELLPATVSVLREGVGGMCQRAKLGRMR